MIWTLVGLLSGLTAGQAAEAPGQSQTSQAGPEAQEPQPAPENSQDTAAAASSTQEAEPPVTLDEGFADYANWFDLTVGGAMVGGNNAAFQQRHQIPADEVIGGVRDLHLERQLGDWLLRLKGHGLFDYHDYSVTLDISQEEKGYLRGGYREFRTFYNGTGGFVPGADGWWPLMDPELYVDRGSAWVEAGLTLPSWPELRVRYEHNFRDGRKDSTIWGMADTAFGPRGIVAGFYDLDERRDIISGELKHTLGKTDLGAKLSYEMGQNDNSLNYRSYPNAPDAYMTQKDSTDSELFNVHAWSTTSFNDHTILSGGYGYTWLDTDLTGSRLFGDEYDPVYDPSVLRGPGFINLSGGAQLHQHAGNVSFMFHPLPPLAVVPSVRLQYQDLDGASTYMPFNPGVEAGTDLGWIQIPDPNATGLVAANSSRRQIEVAERLELRYTGLTNWVFYARGDWDQGDGNLDELIRPVDPNIISTPADTDLQRETDYRRLTQKYTFGVNWYPRKRFSVGAQYYYKQRQNEYDHLTDSTPNAGGLDFYPAFLRDQDFATHDVNVRVTWRPLYTLTSVTRYDFQNSTVDTRPAGLAELQTAELKTHIISESLTWSPVGRWYLQGTISYVMDQTTTPASEGALNTGLVQEAANDYWYATLGTGFAMDEKTDLLATYSYYRANDFAPNYAISMPYGSDAEEHGVSVGLVRRLTANLRCSVRYAYWRYEDQLYGGRNDYDAHVVAAGVQCRF